MILVSVFVAESLTRNGGRPTFHVSVSIKSNIKWLQQVMQTIHQAAGAATRFAQNKYQGSELAVHFMLFYKVYA